MNRAFFFLSILLCAEAFTSPANAQNASLEISVNSLPDAFFPEKDTLFIAGSFNGWNAYDPNYRLVPGLNGYPSITITAEQGSSIEFKFTRGGWETVEGSETGAYIPNRQAAVGNETLLFQIAGFEDFPAPHTAVGNTGLIMTRFHMPELGRMRKIWIRLPNDYYMSEEHYPVLYMHDGQNLFSAGSSFAGEWEIDESMEILAASCVDAIVVGVENGGAFRIDEYAPWMNPQYGGGQGDLYSQFLVETLKPYIDANYRTLPGRENTAIAGSSLGALISLYAALSYPETFGHSGLFSPAFWFNPEIFAFAQNQNAEYPQRFYFTAGSGESPTMVSNMQTVYNALVQAGHPEENLELIAHPDGAHSEWFWAREFIPAMEFLFECGTNPAAEVPVRGLTLYPNPCSDTVRIGAMGRPYVWSVYNMQGQQWMNGRNFSADSALLLDVRSLAPGNYLLQLIDDTGNCYRNLLIHE